MEKNLYIDASHPNETRVVLKSENNIEDYEYEGLKNNLIKNNIYFEKTFVNCYFLLYLLKKTVYNNIYKES